MHPGFIVGIVVATALIIFGIISLISDKKNNKSKKWAVWLIVAGVVALISAVINYNIFGY